MYFLHGVVHTSVCNETIFRKMIIMSFFLLAPSIFAAASPDWNGLRVTWSLNPFNSWAFDNLPRYLDSKSNDWVLRDDQCKIANGRFYGQRFWYKKDPALTLLFDIKGTIAGIQTSVPKNDYSPYFPNRHFIDDSDFWTLTAYFVEPSKQKGDFAIVGFRNYGRLTLCGSSVIVNAARSVCTSGRSQDKLTIDGTGTGLWLQMGPNPLKDSVRIPNTEDEVKKTNWKFGHCFWTMGNHYWYNVTKAMDCGHFVPNCLMYNKGRLTAFCFAINAGLTSSRFEHPTAKEAERFIDPVPDCFFKDPTFNQLSTIHVYLFDSPRTSSWC